MKNIQSFLLLSLATLTLNHQTFADRLQKTFDYYPQNFYSDVNAGLENKGLKDTLHKVLISAHIPSNSGSDELTPSCGGKRGCYQHSPVSYNEARRIVLGKLDLIKDTSGYALKDAYCEEFFTQEDFKAGAGPAPDSIPDHEVFNVEHTWPQSRFSGQFSKHYQKADLFILYGVSTKANSSRQNLEFADVQTEQSPICPAVRRGWVRGNSGTVFFEPPNSHKGNVARAIFYFATRYKMPISETEEVSLKRWHQMDPVDEAEIARHEEIFKIQKVRNPFIDHPELADLISDF